MRLAVFIGAALTAGASIAAPDARLTAEGRAVLDKNCSRCHAIGPQGESTHTKAPPFRIVAKKYPPETLAESLAEGLVSGHPDMPEFVFQPKEIDAIIAYLNSLLPH